MDENLFDLDDFESYDEDCEYLEEYDTDEEAEYEEKQDFNMGIFMTDTSDNSKEHLNLDWEDFSSDDYCKDKCEFYKTCYGNREVCPKNAFKEVFETLTPREEIILKLRFGFCDNKQFSWEETGKYLNLTPNYTKQQSKKPLSKLRHPSRFKILRERKFDFYSANTDFYRNLFKELIGQEDNETLVEIKLGLDYSIIDREKTFDKSIAVIKKELNTKISDICELNQYSSALAEKNIYTLKELLYSSIEKILLAFDYDDTVLFSIQSKLLNMGYRIKTTYYKSKREYFNDYYLEFVSFNLFSNIENQDLIDSTLPSGLVARLLERNITTTNELFELSKYEIKKIINDDKKAEEFFTLIKQYKPTISIDKYNVYNIYVDSKFISYFYWHLFDELHNNGYSIKALHKKIIDLGIDSFEKLINIIEEDFAKIPIEKLLAEYMGDNEILQKTIEEINLSTRAYWCLNRAGINTLEDLTNKTEDDMYKVRNLGKKSLDEVLDKLHSYGLKLKDEE